MPGEGNFGMKKLILALSFCAAAFGQQCTGSVPARPATPAGCSEMRPACDCDSAGSCTWTWACLSRAKQTSTKAAAPVPSNRQTVASTDGSEPAQDLQAIQNLKLRNQAGQVSVLKPPVVAAPSTEPPARAQKPQDQTAEMIQLLERIAVATETIARKMEQEHK
jgi:hypothetical protein